MLVFMTSAMQPHLGSQNPKPSFTEAERSDHSSRKVQDAVSLSEKTTGLPGNQQVHDSLHAAARHIRSLDIGLQGGVRHVRKMADDIRAFKKNFPPFPTGSEERVRLLNSFSAIRKQIARLTLPPETAEIATNNEPTTVPEKALMSRTGSFDQLFAAIRERMPALPTDTSDQSFDALFKKLESLLELIQNKRATIEQQVFSATYSESDGDTALSLEMASLSIRMGQMFSGEIDWQVTVSHAQLKALQV